MEAYKVETTVAEGGTVVLRALPFEPGITVEVIVLGRSSNGATPSGYPLRGQQPYRFDNPCDPVAADDWEATG